MENGEAGYKEGVAHPTLHSSFRFTIPIHNTFVGRGEVDDF
jgi:hypothetical protein